MPETGFSQWFIIFLCCLQTIFLINEKSIHIYTAIWNYNYFTLEVVKECLHGEKDFHHSINCEIFLIIKAYVILGKIWPYQIGLKLCRNTFWHSRISYWVIGNSFIYNPAKSRAIIIYSRPLYISGAILVKNCIFDRILTFRRLVTHASFRYPGDSCQNMVIDVFKIIFTKHKVAPMWIKVLLSCIEVFDT